MFTKMNRNLLALVIMPLIMIGFIPLAGATQPAGPVTIETIIDFSTVPFGGTFVVIQGDDILGCPSGTFTDHSRGGVIEKVFYCDGGTGEFTFLFQPFASPHWAAWKATGAFDGLRGQGVYFFEYIDDIFGKETLTGVIHFNP